MDFKKIMISICMLASATLIRPGAFKPPVSDSALDITEFINQIINPSTDNLYDETRMEWIYNYKKYIQGKKLFVVASFFQRSLQLLQQITDDTKQCVSVYIDPFIIKDNTVEKAAEDAQQSQKETEKKSNLPLVVADMSSEDIDFLALAQKGYAMFKEGLTFLEQNGVHTIKQLTPKPKITSKQKQDLVHHLGLSDEWITILHPNSSTIGDILTYEQALKSKVYRSDRYLSKTKRGVKATFSFGKTELPILFRNILSKKFEQILTMQWAELHEDAQVLESACQTKGTGAKSGQQTE